METLRAHHQPNLKEALGGTSNRPHTERVEHRARLGVPAVRLPGTARERARTNQQSLSQRTLSKSSCGAPLDRTASEGAQRSGIKCVYRPFIHLSIFRNYVALVRSSAFVSKSVSVPSISYEKSLSNANEGRLFPSLCPQQKPKPRVKASKHFIPLYTSTHSTIHTLEKGKHSATSESAPINSNTNSTNQFKH